MYIFPKKLAKNANLLFLAFCKDFSFDSMSLILVACATVANETRNPVATAHKNKCKKYTFKIYPDVRMSGYACAHTKSYSLFPDATDAFFYIIRYIQPKNSLFYSVFS